MTITYNKVNLFNSFTMYTTLPIGLWYLFDSIDVYDFQKMYFETLRRADRWKYIFLMRSSAVWMWRKLGNISAYLIYVRPIIYWKYLGNFKYHRFVLAERLMVFEQQNNQLLRIIRKL